MLADRTSELGVLDMANVGQKGRLLAAMFLPTSVHIPDFGLWETLEMEEVLGKRKLGRTVFGVFQLSCTISRVCLPFLLRDGV